MTHVNLLVSVRDAKEAVSALQGGADIIDAKEPGHGTLGKVNAIELARIINALGADRPVSAACGELVSTQQLDAMPHGLVFQKFGLADADSIDWQSHALAVKRNIIPVKLVIVAYADHQRVHAPEPRQVVDWVSQQPGVGLLIDTAVKDDKNLFDWLDEHELTELIAAAQQRNTTIGLAGSLEGSAFNRAVQLCPDIVGVRGAACETGNRRSVVSATRVRQLAQIIATHNERPATQPIHAAS